jgi:hypothetical protein
VYEPAGDQPTSRLELSLRLEFEALYIAAEDLEFLANAILEANRPAGTHPLPGSLNLEAIAPPVLESQVEARLEIMARRSLLADFSQNQPAYRIAGLTPAQARQRLEQYLPVEPPLEIAIHPRWWPRLPLAPFRIEVYRENPGG